MSTDLESQGFVLYGHRPVHNNYMMPVYGLPERKLQVEKHILEEGGLLISNPNANAGSK